VRYEAIDWGAEAIHLEEDALNADDLASEDLVIALGLHLRPLEHAHTGRGVHGTMLPEAGASVGLAGLCVNLFHNIGL
jgi:hypothetical protein